MDLVENLPELPPVFGLQTKSEEKPFRDFDASKPPKNGKICYWKALNDGVGQGHRHQWALRISKYLQRDQGFSPDIAASALRQWNEKNNPPLAENEINLERTIADGTKYDWGCNDELLKTVCSSECQYYKGTLSHRPEGGKGLFNILGEEDREERYIIKPILSRGDKGYVVSTYKLGKSLFLAQLTLCAATGSPFLGFEVPEAVKVLYIRFELKHNRFNKRLRLMYSGLGINPGMIVSEPVFELVRGFNIMDGRDFDWLTRMIDRHEPALLILDPLYKIASFDLKDTANAMPLIRRFDSIISKYPDLVLIAAHHLRKSTGDEKDSWDSTYGPMFFFADMDFEMRLKAKHRENPEFTFEYISNDLPVDPIMFKRNPETLLYYVSNPKVDHRDEILDYVSQNGTTKGGTVDWMMASLGLSRRSANNTISEMIKDGTVTTQKGKGRGLILSTLEGKENGLF